MATRVFLAIFATMMLAACDQAAPAPMTGDAVSAHSDTSNSGKADSPNNPDPEGTDGTVAVDGNDGTLDGSDGTVANDSTDGDDGSDFPPLNNCALLEIELAPKYATIPGGYDLWFSMQSIEATCEVTIHDGGYAYEGRKVYGTKLPLSFKYTEAERRLECLVHDEDTGQAINILLRTVANGTNELLSEITAEAK